MRERERGTDEDDEDGAGAHVGHHRLLSQVTQGARVARCTVAVEAVGLVNALAIVTWIFLLTLVDVDADVWRRHQSLAHRTTGQRRV